MFGGSSTSILANADDLTQARQAPGLEARVCGQPIMPR